MKKILVLAFILVGISNLKAQDTWKVDPVHSKVTFSVSHLVISEVEGSFKEFSSSFKSEKEDFSDAEISFAINAGSIDTDNDQRDGHLKSEDFFYVEKYPEIKFESTSFKKAGKNKYILVGDLTMRGITKSVTLDVKYGGTIPNDGYGNVKSGFIVKGTLNRMDFGIAWNAKTEHGGWTVGEEVEIEVKLEFVKSKTS